MKNIYFDYAATTPADPEVIKAMEPYLYEKFGNASSPNSFGREANKALEDARDTLASFLGAGREEFIFTSGATESNNQALFGIARSKKHLGNHIIVTKVDHHSVLNPAEWLRLQGFDVTFVNVDEYGLVDPQDIKKAITDKTILVAVIYANNEIGTIQPLADIGKTVKEAGVHFHVDAVQVFGHIPFHVNDIYADTLSLSAHKFYGPKGVGALYIREGREIPALLLGGGQEKSLRASTQNVACVVGMARAIELCSEKMEEEFKAQTAMRNRIISEVTRNVDGVRLNGHPERRLANNANFVFENIQSEALLMSLDMEGIAASMGSACTSGVLEPSHVLRAIGLSDELAMGALRITIGRWTTEGDVDTLLEKLPPAVARLRQMASL